MKLFSNWMFGSKAEENTDVEKQVDNFSSKVNVSMQVVVEDEFNVPVYDDATKKEIKMRLEYVHLLCVTLDEDGSCKILRGEGSQYNPNEVFEKTMRVDEVLEYLNSVEFARVGFIGPFEKTRDLMQKIDMKWYGQQYTIHVRITDGLENFGSEERHEWTRFVLRITQELFDSPLTKRNDKSLDADVSKRSQSAYESRMINETGHFYISENYDDVLCFAFEVFCKQMIIPDYDIIRENLLCNNFTGSILLNPQHYEYAQRIIKKEAESYTEESNGIEYVINGQKRFVSYEDN